MALSGRTTMDFFQGQAAARRKTVQLVFLFSLAVLLTIGGVYMAVVITFGLGNELHGWWHHHLFYNVAVLVVIIVLSGSLYKIIDLKKGGARVAELLGGVHVDQNTVDPDQRRLLNVVQEMAIASGVPVPRVYTLQEEAGINAFAAGYEPHDAVVAVTKGCLSHLSRNELQGVVAHEFSHILNGDMRLNLKLMGTIHGILCLALMGRLILDGRIRSKGRGAGALYLFGLLLVIVGYIGVFFGKLIKSAVSRQREFLADAAAVQFTRDPSGIADALKKIAGLARGSRISNPHAEEASHLFFGGALSGALTRLFSTHPPLPERIRRIEMAYPQLAAAEQRSEREITASRELGDEFLSDAGIQALSSAIRLEPQQFIALVGNTQAVHVEYAQHLLAGVPPLIVEATRDPLGAMALIYCLLLCAEGQTGEQTRDWECRVDQAAGQEIARLRPLISKLGPEHRLPLVDMAWPALKNLSNPQYEKFRTGVQQLIEADRRVDLFEFAVRNLLTNRLDTAFGLVKPRKIRYRLFDQVQMECFELLSILARQGNKSEQDARDAFQKAIRTLDASRPFSILAAEKCNLALLDRTLNRLAETSFDLKRRILSACLLCIGADNRITVPEAELLRAVAENIDCPVPPLIPEAVREAA
ncbi:MAG: M48 family metallopeptidase [Proteobacteria bacterium]|nr:M48 family metallopeptidase [Pseudomonadota bacterium]